MNRLFMWIKPTISACDSRLMKLQQKLTRKIRRHRFENLQDCKSLVGPFLRFAVHTCMWSIVAKRAFRDPGSCNWSTIHKFPPEGDPHLHVTVLTKLIKMWDTTDGAKLLCSSDVTKGEQVTQLVDCMYRVVRESS